MNFRKILRCLTFRSFFESYIKALENIEKGKLSIPSHYPLYKYIPKRGLVNRYRRWEMKNLYWKYFSKRRKPQNNRNEEFYKELERMESKTSK